MLPQVFPLAPLVALLNNIVLIRLMAYKVTPLLPVVHMHPTTRHTHIIDLTLIPTITSPDPHYLYRHPLYLYATPSVDLLHPPTPSPPDPLTLSIYTLSISRSATPVNAPLLRKPPVWGCGRTCYRSCQ